MSDNLRIPDSIDMQRLKAMQMVAKMKEKLMPEVLALSGALLAPLARSL